MSLFEISKLAFQYENAEVLEDITFSINQGESIGIIGPNGTGKSTLLQILSGVYKPTRGQVVYNQKGITFYKKKQLAKEIAFMEQESLPLLSFTVEEVVIMGRYPWLKPFATMKKEDHQLVEEILISLDLWDKKDNLVCDLSGGERQLVALAKAMVQKPKVLFLDEPTTFLDIGHQVMVMNHIREWQKRENLTVIMILHDLNLAAQYTDKLMLIHQGKVMAWGTAEEVLKTHYLEKVYQTKPVVIKHPISGVSQILLHG